MGKIKTFQQTVLKQLNIWKKMNLDLYIKPYKKLTQAFIDLSGRTETINLLEKKNGEKSL